MNIGETNVHELELKSLRKANIITEDEYMRYVSNMNRMCIPDHYDFCMAIRDILIETGQHDTKKFAWGETIKYTPTEVAEILEQHKDELSRFLNSDI